MRVLLLLAAILMPAVSWFSQKGQFGPTNGAISDQYPTLLVAAGYAFSIWGLVFALDVVFGLWQLRQRRDDALARIRPFAFAGFVLTAAWMPIFSQQVFWLSLIVIWASLGCVLYGALVLSRDVAPLPGQRVWALLPLSLHAGWLSLAAFLNTAQVIVAYGTFSKQQQLPWSLVLFAAAAALLLWANRQMRGNLAYAAAAVWGLAAVYVKQSQSGLEGAGTAAWTAAAMAIVVAVHAMVLRLRSRRPERRKRPR
jgi:prepilin signal peptidase PulO-like enzyme (type II secretory pathway)